MGARTEMMRGSVRPFTAENAPKYLGAGWQFFCEVMIDENGVVEIVKMPVRFDRLSVLVRGGGTLELP
jgi:hypothetical protein